VFIELAVLKPDNVNDTSLQRKRLFFCAGFTDVLHSNSCGNYGSADDVVLSTVRGLLLLHSDART